MEALVSSAPSEAGEAGRETNTHLWSGGNRGPSNGSIHMMTSRSQWSTNPAEMELEPAHQLPDLCDYCASRDQSTCTIVGLLYCSMATNTVDPSANTSCGAFLKKWLA